MIVNKASEVRIVQAKDPCAVPRGFFPPANSSWKSFSRLASLATPAFSPLIDLVSHAYPPSHAIQFPSRVSLSLFLRLSFLIPIKFPRILRENASFIRVEWRDKAARFLIQTLPSVYGRCVSLETLIPFLETRRSRGFLHSFAPSDRLYLRNARNRMRMKYRATVVPTEKESSYASIDS